MLDLCERSARAPGVRLWMWWWEQVGIDLAGARGAEVVAAEGEEGEE